MRRPNQSDNTLEERTQRNKNKCNQCIKLKVSIMPGRLGSPNKNTKFLLNRLQVMYVKDFHPIMKMAENAVRLHDIASRNDTIDDLKRSIDAWDRIAKYM